MSKMFLLILLSLVAGSSMGQVRPPDQPSDGPGGKKLTHGAVTKNHYDSGGLEYWLFEPDSPRPRTAPVIVFLHGWGGTNPSGYGAWLDHLVRRGNIVIFPRYQVDRQTAFGDFTPNTITAIKNALKRLQTEQGQVRPELDKFAVVGHSVGGLLTANVAALAKESELPQVRAMMSVEPAPTWSLLPRMNVELADLAKIPSDTLLLAVAGDDDQLANDHDAKRVFYESTKVLAANKNFVTLVSDSRGQPALNAGHLAPAAIDAAYDDGEAPSRRANNANAAQKLAGIDALDYYGLWKLFDGLCNAAFFGHDRQYALGDTPQQRFMGKWSDGTPVKELRVTNKP